MKHILHFSQKALSDLEVLDVSISRRIVHKLEYYASLEDPLQYAKPLKGSLEGLHRFRIGSYRAIFHRDSHGKLVILLILRIQHRKDVYK